MTSGIRVLVTGTIVQDYHLAPLRRAGCILFYPKRILTPEEWQILLRDEKIGVLLHAGDEFISADMLETATALKLIAFSGVGFSGFIDVAAAQAQNIFITNTPCANSQSVAEMTITLILAASRNLIPFYERNKTDAAYNNAQYKFAASDLQGKTLGIFGYGHIGQRVATIMSQAFAMRILYAGPSRKPDAEQAPQASYVTKMELFENSDVVSIHASLTDQSRRAVDAQALRAMRKGAILINTARPENVDNGALYDALAEDVFRVAAYDAFCRAPYEDLSKLMTLPSHKFILTPHIAANTETAWENMISMAAESALVFARDGRLIRQVA